MPKAKKKAPKNKASKEARKAAGPYFCVFCIQRFDYEGGVVIHCQSHNDLEKVCLLCGTTKNDYDSLSKHFMEHVRNFAGGNCSICDVGVIDKEDFITHMLNKHKRQ